MKYRESEEMYLETQVSSLTSDSTVATASNSLTVLKKLLIEFHLLKW